MALNAFPKAARWLSSSNKNKPVVAIAGVTGAVGQELLDLITERGYQFSELRPLASSRSAGKQFKFQGETYTIKELKEDSFEGCDVTFFSAGGSISKKFAPIAGNAKNSGRNLFKNDFYGGKNVVIDNSSAFRMNPNTPLIVPEINPGDLAWLKSKRNAETCNIIANPNCSTIIMNMVVYPIHQVAGVERVVVSTYQAASGAGAEAMRELETQCLEFAKGKKGAELTQKIFGKQYIFNLFSHNSKIDLATGYNEEELKLLKETRKIFNDKDIRVTATCVRVPVLRAHCESINITLKKPLSEEEAKKILLKAPGVTVEDNREANQFPEPLKVSGKDNCFVGRIRKDLSQKDGYGLDMFVAGDQIRKGAALNAIQIAEIL